MRVFSLGLHRGSARDVADLDRLDLDRHDQLGHLVVGWWLALGDEEIVETACWRHGVSWVLWLAVQA